jgi:hypothetical protein
MQGTGTGGLSIPELYTRTVPYGERTLLHVLEIFWKERCAGSKNFPQKIQKCDILYPQRERGYFPINKPYIWKFDPTSLIQKLSNILWKNPHYLLNSPAACL